MTEGKKISILGISCFYHDAAACLVQDGKIMAAAQEERFSRKKHDERFPASAIAYCLSQAGLEAADLDYVVFYDKPFLKFERLIETYLSFAPRGIVSFLSAMPVWIKQKIWIADLIKKELAQFKGQLLFSNHHFSHAASAFFPSPFERAAFLTTDGVGEWATTSFGVGDGNKLATWQEINFPHSLGLLYSAFTYFLGFKVNSGEYKLMGLAPYGEPQYVDLILKNLIDLKEDGSFRLNLKYFGFHVGLKMINRRFSRLFGLAPRDPETNFTQKQMDIAASIQAVTEEIMLRLARHIKDKTGEKNLCLAGGVALNCVANAKILESGLFENIWIQPAAGDAGGALGAALGVWHSYLGQSRPADNKNDSQQGSYLGPEFSDADIESWLKQEKIPYQKLESKGQAARQAVDLLLKEKVVGWFQGRMEFGPRALGNRSILGDARKAAMQSIINIKVKFRESFRPFAPSVLAEKAPQWFKIKSSSPYMLLTALVAGDKRRPLTKAEEALSGFDKRNVERSLVPAVTHVDYSARLQTVHQETNPLYHQLLSAFYEQTGCPVIINTSFNVRGEPIVCSPEDAYRCFMRSNIDYLIMGCFLLDKEKQPTGNEPKEVWQKEFPLD